MIQRIIKSCISFDSYEKILSEPRKKSFFYFIFVIIVSSIIIYPKYFDRQTNYIFPILDDLANKFPSLQFENHQLISTFDKHVVIDNPYITVIIDPDHTSKNTFFTGSWILFGKTALEFNLTPDQSQRVDYKNPFVLAMFTKLCGFKNGSGILDRKFFIELKKTLKNEYYSSGVFFMINFLILGMIFSFILSVLGYIYSSIIFTSLNWKDIRILSYYAITPVLIFMIICYYLHIDIYRLFPILLLIYVLFLTGAIHRFKNPEDDSFEL